MESIRLLAPERKTTVEANIVQPLADFIRATYSDNVLADHIGALQTVNKMREDVRHSVEKTDKTMALYLRYDAMLASMETRFLLGEGEAGNIKLEFSWTDSANPKKKRVEKSFFFERAAHLFNTAALSQQVASVQNVTTVDGLKVAGSSLVEAAGLWKFLKEEYLAAHPECVADDLAEDIEMHQAVALAQAQECMYLSAVKTNSSPGVRAKLALGISRLWNIAAKFVHAQQKRVPKDWGHFADIKEILYKALAFYDAGQASAAAKSYGQGVAYYREASIALEAARKRVAGGGLFGGGAAPAELRTAVEQYAVIVMGAFSALSRDNDSIYHEPDPPLDRLPPIDAKTMVSPRLPALMTGKREDPFAQLVPIAIRRVQSMYDAQRDNLIRELKQEMTETRNDTVAVLSSLNLPAAIQVLENPTNIPDFLRNRMQTVRADNGPERISDLLKAKEGLAREDLQILKEANEMLDKEAQEEKDMKARYGQRWSRPDSHQVAERYRAEYVNYKAKLDHAMNGDSIVTKKWSDFGDDIRRLAGSEQDLLNSLPRPQGAGQSSPHSDKVKNLLAQLEVLLKQRGELEKQLQQLCASDDVSQKLLQEGNHEAVFAAELRKYSPLQDQIRENLRKDVALREPIREHATLFAQTQQGDSSQRQRVEIFTRLELAYKAYAELTANIQEGIQFYTDFQDILMKFKGSCRDFLFARQTEKNDLVAKLESSAPPLSLNSATPNTTPLYGGYAPQHPQASQPPQYQPQTTQYQPAPSQHASTPSAYAPPLSQPQPYYPGYAAPGYHVPAGFPPPQMPPQVPAPGYPTYAQPPAQPQYPPAGNLGPPPPYSGSYRQ